MSRWKVTQAIAPVSSGRIWQVWEGGQRRKVFSTWRKAQDYADEMSRTREVVLPRYTPFPTDRLIVGGGSWMIVERESSSRFPNLPPQYIVVEPGERRPLALALLALAEQEENQN